jgi:hypothetical protein
VADSAEGKEDGAVESEDRAAAHTTLVAKSEESKEEKKLRKFRKFLKRLQDRCKTLEV